MEQATDDSRRRSPRSKVFLAAILEWPDKVLPVTLRNLSAHGALIESAGVIVSGSDVLFRRNDLCVRGHVAWAQGRFAGVAFSKPLKPDVVLQNIARPIPRTVSESEYRRPATRKIGMSAEEHRWSEEILREAKRDNRPK
jgi:hypothetical protein